MSLLFESALGNENLKYIDALDRDNHFTLKKLNEEDFAVFDDLGNSLVFIYTDNSLRSIKAFWIFMKSKHCIALLSDNLSLKQKNALEIKYKPKYIVDLNRKEVAGYQYRLIGSSMEIMVSMEPQNYSIHNEIKILLSTSGTTGSPKFVKLSEQNILQNTKSICDYLPIIKDDVVPLNLPINYSYGLSVLLTNSVLGGQIICSVPDILQREFWNALEEYGFTSIAGVPFVYEMLDRFGFVDKAYPSLRYMTQAGGKLNDELVEKFGLYSLENHIKFYIMYGATEASARMSFLEPDKIITKKGSIGKPIKNGSFEIDSTTSELIYKGPNVFGGYASDYSDLDNYDTSNVLQTGDLARKDSDGYYYIEGRIKRFVKLTGLRINLDEVEELIFAITEIPAKCLGVNDKHLIVFYIQSKLDVKNLKKELSKELRIHNSFIRFKEINNFPLTANGKIDYKKLEDIYDN